MESKSYLYSLYSGFSLLIITAIGGFGFTRGFIHIQPKSVFLQALAVVILLFVVYRLYEVIFLHFLPLFQGKPALELDNEKLSYRVKNKTIYWDEIKQIKPSPYGIFPVKLILKSGKKVQVLENNIRGEEKDIYEDILAYFEKSKTKHQSI